MEQISIVTTVVDARSVAEVLAAAAVAGRFAACAQVGGPMASTYWWQDRMETTKEWSIQLKTAIDRSAPLVTYLRTAHPYDVPEILVATIDSGNPDYARWVYDQTRP